VTNGVTCEEKLRLIEEYTHAAAELTNALRELHLSSAGKIEKGRLQRTAKRRCQRMALKPWYKVVTPMADLRDGK